MIFTSCVETTSNKSEYTFDSDDYSENLAKWKNSEIKNYSLQLTIYGNVPSEDLIETLERRGEEYTLIIKYSDEDSSEEYNYPVECDDYYITSIEDVFALIKKSSDNYKVKFDNQTIVFFSAIQKYDSDFGYPTYYNEIVYEQWSEEETVDGDNNRGLNFSIDNFKKLES